MWSQVLDRKSRRGMSALDSAKVIRYGNTLPKWTADTSKISPQNPIIHRAIPILQLAQGHDHAQTQRIAIGGEAYAVMRLAFELEHLARNLRAAGYDSEAN